MESIKNIPNKRIPNVTEQLKSTSLPVYIWGTGYTGKTVFDILIKNNISIKGFIVDVPYEEKNEIGGG